MEVGIKSETVVMDIWNKNLEIIRQKSPELAEVLSSAIIPADHHVLASKKGPPPCRWAGNDYIPPTIPWRRVRPGPGLRA